MRTQDSNIVISVKAYERPIHLYRCLKSLCKAKKYSKQNHTINISVDRHDDPIVRYQMESAVKLVMEEFDTWFNYQMQDYRLGCLKNTEFCLKESIRYGADYLIHIEEDQILEPDCLNYFEQVIPLLKEDSVFAACTYHSPCHQDFNNDRHCLGDLVAKNWFQGSGPFMISKQTFKRIGDMGGMFGINGMQHHCYHPDCIGEEWKKGTNISSSGTWDWPFHKYFGAKMFSIYPRISRSQNIGELGMHNQGENNSFYEVQYNEDISSKYASDEDYQEVIFDLGRIQWDNRKFLVNGIMP
jgi:hypothetical protein